MILFAGNTIRHFYPVSLDADYLTNVSMSFDTPYEDLIYTHELEQGDGVFCFATIANNNQKINLVYLEKNKPQYSYKYKFTFNVNTLFDDDTKFDEVISVNSSYKNETVYYSVFTDPQRKSVAVNGQEVSVKSITFQLEGETQTIGFWSVVLPNYEMIYVS